MKQLPQIFLLSECLSGHDMGHVTYQPTKININNYHTIKILKQSMLNYRILCISKISVIKCMQETHAALTKHSAKTTKDNQMSCKCI